MTRATRKPHTTPPPRNAHRPAPRASERAATPGVIAGFNGNRRVPPPVNEPVKSYAPGNTERAALKDRLASMASERIDIPLIIGGREIFTGDRAQAVMPHAHRK